MKNLMLLSLSVFIFFSGAFAQTVSTTETINESNSAKGLEDGFYRATVRLADIPDHRNKPLVDIPDHRNRPDKLFRVRVSGNTVSMIDLHNKKYSSAEFQTYNTGAQRNGGNILVRQETYTYDSSELTAQTDTDGKITAYHGIVTIYQDNGLKNQYKVLIPVE